MAYISNNPVYRLTPLKPMVPGEQTHAISTRHANPLITASSIYAGSSDNPPSGPLTYVHLANDSKNGPSVISSQSRASTAANPQDQTGTAGLKGMGAIGALLARYERDRSDLEETTQRSKLREQLEFSIKTKDGDTIDLSISAGASDSPDKDALAADFSLSVAGDLSDEEREAVDALVKRLGDLASVYQKNGWADVEFLDSFDSDVLSGFDLNVSGMDGKALMINYSLDVGEGTHTLAVSQNDYQYELSAETFLGQGASALQRGALYHQYQQVLVDTTRYYRAGDSSGGMASTDVAEFFLDGLKTMLLPQASDQEDLEAKSSNLVSISAQEALPDSAAEAGFLSGLPDFSASFRTPEFRPNGFAPGEISQMTLTMSQETDISVNAATGIKTLSQNHSFDARVSQHFGFGGDGVEHANLGGVNKPGGQTYWYEVARRSANLSRAVDINSDGVAVGYREDKNSSHTKTVKEVVGGEVTGVIETDLTNPTENYSFDLQLADLLTEQSSGARKRIGYEEIKMLQEAIKSQRIDLYS